MAKMHTTDISSWVAASIDNTDAIPPNDTMIVYDDPALTEKILPQPAATDHTQEVISSYVLAKMFIEKFGHLFIVNGGTTFYYFNGQYWHKDCVKGGYSVYMAELFSNEFYRYIDNWITETFINELSIRQFDNVKKFALKLRDVKFKRDLQNEILMCEGLRRDVKFDNHPFLLGFMNGVMDFETNQFRHGRPEDFISTPVRYDWKEPCLSDVEFVEKIFQSIFSKDEERKLISEILFTCLLGIRVNQFIIANGRGANGKDVIFGSMLPAVLGPHYLKSKNQLLLYKHLPVGTCQELAEMNNKRVVVFSEPNSSSRLISETIKEITGSNTLNARGLYEKETEINITATFIMMCNNKPRLDRSDDAMKNRVIDFPFNSFFVSPQDISDYPEEQRGTTVFERKTEYATIEFWNKYRCAIVAYLMKYKNLTGVFQLPENIKNRNLEYLIDSDFIQRWIEENYESVDDSKVFVRLSDVFDKLKQSDYYFSMSKSQRRQMNKSWFVKLISEHFYYRKFYRETIQFTENNRRTSSTNVITNFKERDEATLQK